jgi:hypothetical protein
MGFTLSNLLRRVPSPNLPGPGAPRQHGVGAHDAALRDGQFLATSAENRCARGENAIILDRQPLYPAGAVDIASSDRHTREYLNPRPDHGRPIDRDALPAMDNLKVIANLDGWRDVDVLQEEKLRPHGAKRGLALADECLHKPSRDHEQNPTAGSVAMREKRQLR